MFYRFFTQSMVSPNETALLYRHKKTSYQTLSIQIEKASRKLPDVDYIILNSEKNEDYIVLMLACIRKGVPFVPVPQETPESRLEFIKKDLMKDRKEVEVIKNLEDIEDNMFSFHSKMNEIAYIIYTSGSTGNPKGVVVGYEGLLNIIEEQIKTFEMTTSDRFMWLLSLGFDASLSDIFVTLCSNATLVIPDKTLNELLITSSIYETFNQQCITVSDIPPSVLKRIKPDGFNTLKKIVVGGEVASMTSLNEFYEGGVNVFSVYGPTEATICTSISKYSSSFTNGEIGDPVQNIHYTLSDEGELLISGIGLAIGYTNDELTQEKFIVKNGVRYYKSGDLVSIKSGKYIFEGRLDRQFKKNGQLVCPEEVEKALLNIDNVIEATVYYEGTINAVVSLKENQGNQQILIKDLLKNQLPGYMVPSTITIREQLEKNANDKIVFKKNNPVLNEVTRIFEEVLKQEVTDTKERFYNLGGDSLLFMDVILKLEELYEFDVMDIVEDDSIEGIVRAINKKDTTVKDDFNDLLPSAPEFRNDIKDEHVVESKSFFLTGGTGFLGAHLLSELTLKGFNVFCLVRSENKAAGFERVVKNTEHYGLSVNKDKISIVVGDIESKDFGISSDDLNAMKNKVCSIIHSAALVNNMAPLPKMIDSNVKPSKFLIEIANMIGTKEIHNMSTLSVFVSSNKTPSVIKESMSCQTMNVEDLYTTYAQSKWLNEYYLDKYSDDIHVIHYRLGLLTPSKMFPYFNERDYLKEVFEKMIQPNVWPKNAESLSFDITPVDLAASKMVQLIIGKPNGNIFHITTNQQVSVKDLSSVFNFELTDNVQSSPIEKFSYELHGKNPFMNIFETTRVKTFSPKVTIDMDKISYLESYKRGLKNV